MVPEELHEFEHVWTTDAPNYVLWEAKEGYLAVKMSGDKPMALVIEDDAVARIVHQRMIDFGVPVVKDLPGR